MQLIEKLQPRDINDFVPLIRVSVPVLARTRHLIVKEKDLIPEGNRIYYLSKRLEMDPAIVSKHLATNMFMFEIKFDKLQKKVEVVIENKANDVKVVKSTAKSVKGFLERLQRDRLSPKPLLLNFHENIFENTSTHERGLPTTDNAVVQYISERLGTDLETTRIMLNEKLMRVRISKVQEIMEYLLDKEKFEPLEVGSAIRILNHSLETTKKRINEMKELRCRPILLSTVCLSQAEYNSYLQRWIERQRISNIA